MFHYLTFVAGAAYQIWSLTDLGITYRTIGEIETARQKVGTKNVSTPQMNTKLRFSCLKPCIWDPSRIRVIRKHAHVTETIYHSHEHQTKHLH